MLSRTATDAESDAKAQPTLLKKVWLPKFFYDSLPYFYIVSGIAALLTTLYIHHWLWVVPHYVLFSVACAHFGILLYRRRNRKN